MKASILGLGVVALLALGGCGSGGGGGGPGGVASTATGGASDMRAFVLDNCNKTNGSSPATHWQDGAHFAAASTDDSGQSDYARGCLSGG